MTADADINVSVTPAKPLPVATALGAAGICILTFLAYLPAMKASFIWDDDYYVTANRSLRSFEGLRTIWIGIIPDPRAYAADVLPQYYPATLTSFWLEYRIWGANATGYHIVNVLLHATSALLLWIILRKLAVPGAWVIAAIWAIHPVQVESVAWITERKNVLSGVFYLCSLLVYMRFCGLDEIPQLQPGKNPLLPTERWKLYLLALFLFVCALLSKSVTGSLPAAVLLLIWWKRGRINCEKDVVPLIPFFVLAILMGIMTSYMERNVVGAQGREWAYTWPQRLIIAGRALWFYIYKLIWPANLNFTYEKWRIEMPQQSWQLLFGAAAVAIIVALIVQHKRLGRGPAVAALFFVVTLFPALGFFNVDSMRYSYVTDRYQYFASVGLIALIVPLAYRVIKLKEAAVTVAAVVLLILGVLTFRQATNYKDNQTLWTRTLESSPNSWFAHDNYGVFLLRNDRVEDALERFQNARRLYRQEYGAESVSANMHIGLVAERRGELAAAEQYFLRSINQCQHDGKMLIACAEPLYNLGRLYMRIARPDDAIRAYEAALQYNPRFSLAMTNLGVLYADRHDYDKAIELYTQSLELDPDSISTRTNLGNAYLQQGDIQDAVAQWMEVIRVDPNNANVLNSLGGALMHIGQWDPAIVMFEKALARNPNLEPAKKNLETAKRNKAIAATRPSTTRSSRTGAASLPSTRP